MKRPRTKKQREASRRNAQKSTGPRSPEGKARSRENALSHGLSATTCIYKPIRNEDPAQFAELRAKLFSDCQPVGTQEELAVEMMAAAYHRVRRVEAWETAYMDVALMTLQADHGAPMKPTSHDDMGCGIVLGEPDNKLTWEHLDRLRRSAWTDYRRAQAQFSQLQKERLERPVKEYKALVARENYLERTHVATARAKKQREQLEKEGTSAPPASFCPRCEHALDELIHGTEHGSDIRQNRPAAAPCTPEDLPAAA